MAVIRRMRPVALVLVFLAGVVGLQAARERLAPLGLPAGATGNILYLQSPEVVRRAALSFDALLADGYWMRAVQHYGRTKLSSNPSKQYDILYPLLNLTTSLDPRFDIAYRYGAVFLAEAPPSGPGRPDQAIALLEKGLMAQPDRWEFAQDIGFIYYWWERDYVRAAQWFTRASSLPGAPNWMAPLAAVALSQGGNRATSRQMWQQILASARPDEQWLRDQGTFRLRQLDAMDDIEALQRRVETYRQQAGGLPETWADLVRAGLLPGVPVDPMRYPYALNPYWGTVTLDERSTLNPLPEIEASR